MISFRGCMVVIFPVIGTLLLVDAKPLHHQMTEKEIEKFFGVKASADVPEYEISEPYQSNEHGEFVSHTLHPRNTRGIHNSGTWFYKMDAFGNKMRLKLTRNTQLVKPGLKLETRNENGDFTKTPVKTDSLFHGREVSDPDSLVAVSNDGGLTGMIKLSSETLFVHPLPDHLAKHVTTTRSGAKPHLVYRKSSERLHCETKAHKSDAAPNLVANGIQSDVNSDSYNPPAHKYLQAALVADENVVAKHGNHTADFLLILANIVAGTYRDNSIGKIKVNYVVSRLIFITNKELNVTADSTNYEKLGKIRGWAYKNKPQDTNDPLYFDDISLVHVGHGGGLALAGGMCSYRVTGNVNAYRGLQTAGIIAHETAHNIGVGHDDGYTNCSDGVNIMSTGLPGGEGALKWSSCSRAVLQQFFSGPGSKCLDDPPQITLPAFSNTDMSDTLPGVLYDGDTQCEFQYGAGYTRCFLDNCVRLFCNKPGTSYCSSIFAPPADGTRCGTHKWCIKGKCVDNGLPRIHGGWSEWSADYSPCSATCGGGVQFRHRSCTNPPPKNNGDDCLGSAKGKWKICNSQTECPLPSARDLLCNKVQPGTSAYYSGDPCKLRCITPGSMLYFYGTVPDGFRCTNRPEILDVCTEGKCRAVGCDHVLESGKKRDRCEVCGGNGETCVFENSSYTQAAWNYGFDKENLIVVLPVGTTNAKFKQRKIGYNMLGIKDHLTGQYLINLPSWSRAVYYKGSRIKYKHDDNRFADTIVVDGPTKVPLRVTFIYLYEKNQGVDYQYYRPLKSGEAVQHAPSKWATGEWSACSAKCGQGFITRDVSCVRSDDGTPASAQSCSSIIKPRSRKTCKTQDCIPEWHLTNWNDCSKSCGNGSHSRQLYCRRKFNESYYEIRDESSCNGTARPASGALFQRCNEIPCPPEWRTLPWSLCSKTCGGGLMTRKLECIRTDELGHVIPAAKELCRYAVKPLTETVCNDDKPCDPPTEIQVACFAGADNLEEVLGDFTKEIQWDNTNDVVKMCAKLVHAKGYKIFALGKDGLCLSGPHTRQRYYISGTDGADCKDGIGMGNSIFVYALDHVPSLQALGCYHDSYHDRAMSDQYANFRSQIIWTKMNLTVKQCARVAYDKGYEYFAIQFYGECWGGQDAGKSYAKHGPSDGCWVFDSHTGHGVGGDLTNFVYRLNKDVKTRA